jgi:hypothetical protein
MTIAELKVEMFEIILSIQDEKKALRMLNFLRSNRDITDYNLTSEQEAELFESIKESYDTSKWITHEEMKKKHKRN